MFRDLFIASALLHLGNLYFGHFEAHTPRSRRVSKFAFLVGATALLHKTVGRPWPLVWIVGMFGGGLGFHFWWTLRHGIHPLTAEPKDRYYALRGWEDRA